MAAPAFGTAGTQLQGSAATMNVDVPDSVAANDIIVVTAYLDSTMTVTGLASGFAHAPDSPVQLGAGAGAGRHSMSVMWKRATGADSTAGTYDFTLSGSTYRNAQAIRYTGAATSGSPWDVTNFNIEEGVGTSTTPAVSDTTTGADRLLIWSATNWSGGAWTPPSAGGTWTERRDSGDQVCTVADKAQAVAGATGSITGTAGANDRMTAWLGALMPPGAAFVAPPALIAGQLPALIRASNI